MYTLKKTIILVFTTIIGFSQNQTTLIPGTSLFQSYGVNLNFQNGNLGLGNTTPLLSKFSIRNVNQSTYGLSVASSISLDNVGRVAEFVTPDFSYLSSGSALNFTFSNFSGNSAIELEAYSAGKNSPSNILLQPRRTGLVGIGTLVPKTKLHLSGGDLYIESPNDKIVIKSPNGSCWKITVNDYGQLSSYSTSCP
jgi:hypothetical protein